MSWLMEIGLFPHPGAAGLSLPAPRGSSSSPAPLSLPDAGSPPITVFLSLPTTRFGWGEKAFIAWVGLRGAIPIVLATFPLLAGVGAAQKIFNVSFFVVLVSLLVQGTTLSWAARVCRVEEGQAPQAAVRLEA